MPREITEADWKLFRQLREVALERFCERALADVSNAIEQVGQTSHDCFLRLLHLVNRQNKELASLFDDPRRSTAVQQLALIRKRGLLTDDEFRRFDDRTRDSVEVILQL